MTLKELSIQLPEFEPDKNLADPRYFVLDLKGDEPLPFGVLVTYANKIAGNPPSALMSDVKFIVINDKVIIFNADNDHRLTLEAMKRVNEKNDPLHKKLGKPAEWKLQCGGELLFDRGSVSIEAFSGALAERRMLGSSGKEPQLLAKKDAAKYVTETMQPNLQRITGTMVKFDPSLF